MRMLNRIAFSRIRKVRIDIFIPISIHLIYGNVMPKNPDKNPKKCLGIIDTSIFVIGIIEHDCIFILHVYSCLKKISIVYPIMEEKTLLI